jgi:hypothetical protein
MKEDDALAAIEMVASDGYHKTLKVSGARPLAGNPQLQTYVTTTSERVFDREVVILLPGYASSYRGA